MEAEDPGLLARQRLHTTIFSQCFSGCGKYLATCNNFGHIGIFCLQSALSPEATVESWKPILTFKAHDGPVYSLVSTERQLISAGTGDIKAWNWPDIITKAPKVVWTLPIPSENKFENPETNSIVLSQKNGDTKLFAGCGDNNIHIWDIESGTLTTSLQGHTDYVHTVAIRSNGYECVSGSEDGTVRVWDSRSSDDALHIIEPHKNDKCYRPQFGKWIGCVAVDSADDWLVCGGGPQLSLWHLRSLACTSVFDIPQVCHQHVMFNQDSIISAGTQPFVYHWSVNGELRAKVPCTPTSVFNVAINDKAENTKVLSIGGSSEKIDICTNPGYKAFSLTFW